MEFLRLSGTQARAHTEALAELRLSVFHHYPYLYEGTLDYEKKYLETYFKAQRSFVLLVLDQGKAVGATTGIWAAEEEESFHRPLVEHGLDPARVFYLGESVLLPQYRGRGVGKKFFQEREAFARTLPEVELLAFCAVVRPDDHPLRPADYQPLDGFWRSQGFEKVPGMTTSYRWRDIGQEKETNKVMQYWMKELR